jgi:Fe2+ or Zn2+ uptake regulation protein
MEARQNLYLKAHEHHSSTCNGKLFQDFAFDALKAAQFRITKPRLAIIGCLAHSEVPLSPKNIYENLLKNSDIKVDQVSVYRILETFTQLNLIHQVFPSGDYLPCTTRCEKNSNHIILNCTKCGKVTEVDLEWHNINMIFENVKNKFHFQPAKQMFQIDGICHECR